jgi:hypothetical protein
MPDFLSQEEFDRAGREDRSGGQWALLSAADSLRKIAHELSAIRAILEPHHQLTRLELTLMPATIAVGAVATATLLGFDQNGNAFAIPASATIVMNAATPADVSFGTPVFNADGSVSVPVTAVNADPGDAISATVNGIVSTVDTLTITTATTTPQLTTVTLTLAASGSAASSTPEAREAARLKSVGQN